MDGAVDDVEVARVYIQGAAPLTADNLVLVKGTVHEGRFGSPQAVVSGGVTVVPEDSGAVLVECTVESVGFGRDATAACRLDSRAVTARLVVLERTVVQTEHRTVVADTGGGSSGAVRFVVPDLAADEFRLFSLFEVYAAAVVGLGRVVGNDAVFQFGPGGSLHDESAAVAGLAGFSVDRGTGFGHRDAVLNVKTFDLHRFAFFKRSADHHDVIGVRGFREFATKDSLVECRIGNRTLLRSDRIAAYEGDVLVDLEGLVAVVAGGFGTCQELGRGVGPGRNVNLLTGNSLPKRPFEGRGFVLIEARIVGGAVSGHIEFSFAGWGFGPGCLSDRDLPGVLFVDPYHDDGAAFFLRTVLFNGDDHRGVADAPRRAHLDEILVCLRLPGRFGLDLDVVCFGRCTRFNGQGADGEPVTGCGTIARVAVGAGEHECGRKSQKDCSQFSEVHKSFVLKV